MAQPSRKQAKVTLVKILTFGGGRQVAAREIYLHVCRISPKRKIPTVSFPRSRLLQEGNKDGTLVVSLHCRNVFDCTHALVVA